MKKLLLGLSIFFLLNVPVFAQDIITSIIVNPSEKVLNVGEDFTFTATAYDSSNNVVETTFTWSIEAAAEIGTINNGEFTASAIGSGFIVASADSADTLVVGEASITVNAAPVDSSIQIFPDSATVIINETAQFEAQLEGVEGVVVWAVVDEQIGEIDSLGLFTAKAEGETKVTATIGDLTDEADVAVVAVAPPLPEGINIINIQRQHPDGKITKFGSAITEGDTVTIGGIPYPFNYMNGMKLFFPENSLDEDILITIKIPEKIIKINNQKTDVTFEENLVNAVTFNVSVAGVEQHPYNFVAPIELSLPYKKGLLTNLGIEPKDLAMYYLDAEGNLLSEGITDVALDSLTNKITGTVAHFSDIVLAPRSVPTIAEENSQPSQFTLLNNYPNPFNPETTISYSLAKSARVSISIYNIVGQQVKNLIETTKPAGSYSIKWDGKDNTGARVTSGLYLCRMEAGNFSQTRKLMLMK